MHRFTDTDTLKYYIVTLTLHKVILDQMSWCQMKDNMHVPIFE